MKKAFTLIELLVVIAIIAILAAILFPVFAQAKEAAKKTQCLSNIKNLSLAVIMYTGDYDDLAPQSSAGPNPPTPAQVTAGDYYIEWSQAVYPYIKNGTSGGPTTNGGFANYGGSGIFACPDFPTQGQFNQYGIHADMSPVNDAPYGLDYTANGNAPQTPGATTQVPSPSSIFMIAEKGANGTTNASTPYVITRGGLWSSNPWVDYGTATIDNCALGGLGAGVACYQGAASGGDQDMSSANEWVWAAGNMFPRYRHASTSNMAFWDGHAKSEHKGQFNWGQNVAITGLSWRWGPGN